MMTDLPSGNHTCISNISINACSLSTWIIDSGASHHICISFSWFQSYTEITPINIKLPNGNFAIAKSSGTVRFSNEFILENVLYVPNFSINLIAVSKLCHTPNFLLTFNNSKCVIQDQRTMKMIGFANEHGGLYYLNLTNKNASVSAIDGSSYPSIPTKALWHFRLGHPSHSRLVSLKSKFPYVVVDQGGVCDVCHLARHKKLLYQNSFNKAKQAYDVIHFDIWGPISINSVHGHSYFLTAIDDFSRYTWVILVAVIFGYRVIN